MAKTKISEYSSTASSNTDIDGINLAEGMAPSLVNNAIRELMAQLKDQQDGSSGDDFTVTGTLTATELNSGDITVLGSAATSSVTINATTVTVPSSFTLTGSTFDLSGTGAVKLPVGTTAQRPTSATGQLRYNTTLAILETYDGSAWVPVGGANGGGGAIFENANTVSANYTITTNKNGMSAGPITVASGVTVTVPSGSRWVIV